MKRNIFVCLLVGCAIFMACSKDNTDYAKYFVGRYNISIVSQITDSVTNVTPESPFLYVMTINKSGEDSLLIAFDSTYFAKGYADKDGLHIEKISVAQKYLVASGTEGSRNFTCKLNFVEFVMPRPISNGTNQLSRFRATTTGSGTIDNETHPDVTLTNIYGTSIISATMTNDPNVIINHDTTSFPGKKYRY